MRRDRGWSFKGVLWNNISVKFYKFKGRHLLWSLRPATLLEKELLGSLWKKFFKMLFYRTHVDGCFCHYNVSVFIENTCFVYWKHHFIELYKENDLALFMMILIMILFYSFILLMMTLNFVATKTKASARIFKLWIMWVVEQ